MRAVRILGFTFTHKFNYEKNHPHPNSELICFSFFL
jgi:hypothetical protein